jgi:hypothetical protein
MDPSPERGHESDFVLHRQDDAAKHEEALDIDAARSPMEIVHPDSLLHVARLWRAKATGGRAVRDKEGERGKVPMLPPMYRTTIAKSAEPSANAERHHL